MQPGAATGHTDNKQMALSNGSFISVQCGFQFLIFHGAWIEFLNFLTLNFHQRLIPGLVSAVGEGSGFVVFIQKYVVFYVSE